MFMTADKNQDYSIGPDEIDVLVARLNSLPGVEVNEQSLRGEFQKNKGSIMAFMSRNLNDDDTMARIFTLR